MSASELKRAFLKLVTGLKDMSDASTSDARPISEKYPLPRFCQPGGRYLASDLESQAATLSMSGGGEAALWVKDSLFVDLSGGVQVQYYGKPMIDQSLSGGSNLKSLGDR